MPGCAMRRERSPRWRLVLRKPCAFPLNWGASSKTVLNDRLPSLNGR
jgi:hypothetical protein